MAEAATSGTRLRAHGVAHPAEKEYLDRIGSLDGAPVLAVTPRELQKRALDHRAGFVVSRIDGQSSVEELLDVCAMPRVEALRILADLIHDGVVWIVKDR